MIESPGGDIPESIQCGICSNVCKRGVKVLCCNTRACRSCATCHVTRNKICWNSSCGHKVNTADLVNDEALREDVEKYQNDLKDIKNVTDMAEKNEVKCEEQSGIKSEEAKKEKMSEVLGHAIVKQQNDMVDKNALLTTEKADKKEIDCKEEKAVHSDEFYEDAQVPSKDEDGVQETENHKYDMEVDIYQPTTGVVKKEERKCEEETVEEMDEETPEASSEMAITEPGVVTLAMMEARNTQFDQCMSPVEKASKELRFGAQLELLLLFEAEHASCLMCGHHLDTEFLCLKHIQMKHKEEYGQLKIVLQTTNMNTLNMFLHKAIRSEFLYQQNQIFPVPVNY